MSRLRRAVKLGLSGVVALALLLGVVIYAITFHPADREVVSARCAPNAPSLKPGQRLKVLSWNVQYMASKRYVFYYDTFEGDGPDDRPSAAHIAWTLEQVARVIREEDPDVVLLQEVDEGASRTDRADQAALLEALMPDRFACRADAFYWKAAYVPHPRIMGSVGLKLTTLTKHKIARAERIALPLFKQNPLTDMFYIKRAVLRADLAMEDTNSAPLATLNVHLDAFAQGSDTMQQQVGALSALIKTLDDAKQPWVLGGDLNLLGARAAYDRLGPGERRYFSPQTEFAPLLQQVRATPSVAEIEGADYAKWLTHAPNDPRAGGLDRTIDYILTPTDMTLHERYVRLHDTLDISDHMPVVVTLEVSARAP